MNTKAINKVIQEYDLKLNAVIVEGYIDGVGGFRYMGRGVRIQWTNQGVVHDIADYFKEEADPHRILKDLQSMDTQRGADTFKDIQKKNRDNEREKEERGVAEIMTIHKDVAKYAANI